MTTRTNEPFALIILLLVRYHTDFYDYCYLVRMKEVAPVKYQDYTYSSKSVLYY